MKKAMISNPSKVVRRSGAAALELAVTLPFLIFVFAAAVDFARVFHTSQVIATATGTGALYASGAFIVPGYSNATCAVAARTAILADGAALNPPLQANQVQIRTEGSLAVITVDYDMPLILDALYADRNAALRRTVKVRYAPRPGD